MNTGVEHYAAVFDQLDDAVMLLVPENGKILLANEAAASWLGTSRDALVGQSAVHLGLITADECQQAIQVHPQATSAVLPWSGEPASSPAWRWIEVTRRALAFAEGWLIVSVWRDVTKAKETEHRMHAFNEVFRHAPYSVVVVDPQAMRFVDVNEAAGRLHGHTRQEMLKLGLEQQRQRLGLWSEEDLRQRYRKLIDTHPAVSIEVHAWPGDRIVESIRRAVRLDGQWLVITVSRDVTERKASEQRMKWLVAAIDNAADAIQVIDPARMAYSYINEAAVRLFGLSRQVMMERGVKWVTRYLQIWSEADQREQYRQLIAQYPQPVSSVQQLLRHGRESIWIETTARAMESDGQWVIVTVARDITERKLADRRVQQLYAAMNQAPDSIMIIDPEQLEYIDVNEGCGKIFGLPRESILRMGLRRLNEMARIWTPDELRQRHRWLIDNYPELGHETVDVCMPGRSRIVTDTTRRAVAVEGRWIIITVLRDVTERKLAEEQALRLKAAIDQAVDAIFVIDPQTMGFVDVNESGARMYGSTREEMLATGVEAVALRFGLYAQGEIRQRLRALVAQAPEPTVENLLLRFPDGRETIVETTRRAVQIEGKWQVLVVSRDVTERERASAELNEYVQELARSNRDLEQFAYVTSHDLSEPLRMVASFTQMLDRRYGPQLDTDGREFLGYIVSGAQRMKQLIDDLLAYARAGLPDMQMEPIPLDRALDQALDNLAHALREADVVIERPPALPTLAIEKTGLTQVFQNLVSNALKFRGERPARIRIGMQRDGAHWTVSVQDNGIGIDPAYFDLIFVIFQRLHPREEYAGTGIGLSICKKIVERHGGRIWAEAAPDGGACFKFTLPVQQAA